jgi:hypothetical protein
MIMANEHKCAHQACNCMVQQGQQYCGTSCQEQAQQGGGAARAGQQQAQGSQGVQGSQGRQQQQGGGCGCGHPACQHA